MMPIIGYYRLAMAMAMAMASYWGLGAVVGCYNGRLYLVRLFYKLYIWVHFRYKNGDCIENDYYAVSGGPSSGASDCRDSFVSRCRITLVPL
jgi:hypothetical protein